MPALLVGTATRPIEVGKTALIRLHLVDGLDPQSCPAIVACGGRVEYHGQAMPRTWVKLGEPVPEPKKRFELNLRSVMSAGESVGVTVIEWAREHLGVTINEMFGQTEINYVVGNCQAAWPVKPGSIGRPYPGHQVAVIDETGNEVPRGTLGEMETLLAPHGFLRVHRSLLVNERAVRELLPRNGGELTLVLASGTRLVASRSHRRTLEERWRGRRFGSDAKH